MVEYRSHVGRCGDRSRTPLCDQRVSLDWPPSRQRSRTRSARPWTRCSQALDAAANPRIWTGGGLDGLVMHRRPSTVGPTRVSCATGRVRALLLLDAKPACGRALTAVATSSLPPEQELSDSQIDSRAAGHAWTSTEPCGRAAEVSGPGGRPWTPVDDRD